MLVTDPPSRVTRQVGRFRPLVHTPGTSRASTASHICTLGTPGPLPSCCFKTPRHMQGCRVRSNSLAADDEYDTHQRGAAGADTSSALHSPPPFPALIPLAQRRLRKDSAATVSALEVQRVPAMFALHICRHRQYPRRPCIRHPPCTLCHPTNWAPPAHLPFPVLLLSPMTPLLPARSARAGAKTSVEAPTMCVLRRRPSPESISTTSAKSATAASRHRTELQSSCSQRPLPAGRPLRLWPRRRRGARSGWCHR
ncbi:hypothetical protein C8J57DRAFT_1274691 [Mycena rebaudengoi]|nr:hypothetical protein C8J57DRAFT_1274691 [Mycena rebaudengoi]